MSLQGRVFLADTCYTQRTRKLLYGSALENSPGGQLRPGHARLALNSFRYLGDPLFLLTSFAYALNRWVLKPRIHSAFLHDHFNDLLLIPCALPPVLLLQRWLGLRRHDRLPSAAEIFLHLVVWSVLFELLGPYIFPWTVGDPWDVAAYIVGGIAAGLWWTRRALRSQAG